MRRSVAVAAVVVAMSAVTACTSQAPEPAAPTKITNETATGMLNYASYVVLSEFMGGNPQPLPAGEATQVEVADTGVRGVSATVWRSEAQVCIEPHLIQPPADVTAVRVSLPLVLPSPSNEAGGLWNAQSAVSCSQFVQAGVSDGFAPQSLGPSLALLKGLELPVDSVHGVLPADVLTDKGAALWQKWNETHSLFETSMAKEQQSQVQQDAPALLDVVKTLAGDPANRNTMLTTTSGTVRTNDIDNASRVISERPLPAGGNSIVSGFILGDGKYCVLLTSGSTSVVYTENGAVPGATGCQPTGAAG